MNVIRAFPPVLSAFMQSDARHRFVLGPFGCLPCETEFLTPSGWVAIGDYNSHYHKKIAQWHPANGVSWVEPDDFISQPCEEFIRFESRGLVMELSPEHRVPHWNWQGVFGVCTAEAMARRPSKRTIPTTFRVPDGPGLVMSDSEIRVAVMIHADGHYPPGGQVIVCVRKERKKARIRELLSAVSIEWTERTYPQRPTETSFVFYPTYRGKTFDATWWGANARQLAVIAEEVTYWDGGRYNYAKSGRQALYYFSTNRQDADFVQYACHASGQRASISFQEPRLNEKICWRVCIRHRDSYKNVAQVRGDNTRISKVPSSDGAKYCFTVSSGFFVARHEGTIFITGNSGKSVAAQTEIVRRAGMQRPSSTTGKRKSRFAVVRNTRPQLRDTTLKTWLDQFPNGTLGNYQVYTSTYKISHHDIECEVIFLPLENDDDVKKLLSLELTGVYLNEFRDITRGVVEALDGRIGRYPRIEEGGPTWVGIWGDSNMPDERTWWWAMLEQMDPEDMLQKKPNKWVKFVQPPGMIRLGKGRYVVNPQAENLQWLPEGYYENLITDKTEDFIRTTVMCEYGRSRGGKPVHPLFVPELHIASEPLVPNPRDLLLLSADFGLTPAIVAQQQNAFGQVRVYDSIAEFGMGLERVIEEKLLPLLRRKYDGYDIFVTGDPSGDTGAQSDETSCADVFRRYSKKGLGKVKFAWSNNPIHRQGALDHFLRMRVGNGLEAYQVDPQALALIAALQGGYQFKLYKDGRQTSEVEKNSHSHVGEASEYGAMYYERGGRRKADLTERMVQQVQQSSTKNHYAMAR